MPHLAPYWRRSLREYASAAYKIEHFHSDCRVRNRSMELLRDCVENAARRSGFTNEEARRASYELLVSPVLQTGPHCLLLVEPDAFYTHIFSLLGLKAQNREWHITYFVSTMTFKETAKKGPGWLRLEGEPLNVFGLSRSKMDGCSIGCSNGPYRFALSNSKGEAAPNPSAASLLAELPSNEFPSAAEAIKVANYALWQRRCPSDVKLLQLDDFDIADLIASHLNDPTSWMSAHFIGDASCAESVLNAIDQLNTGPWSGWVRRTTDFFWRLEKDRVVPLRLQGGVLRAGGSSSFDVKFNADGLATALRRRAILPSLFTAFLVTSILPGVRVLGGCRQTIYLPLMRYLASIAVQRSGNIELLNALGQDDRPGLLGHRVLKPADGDPTQEIELAGGIGPLLSRYAETSLERGSGDLASFTQDPIWAELSAQITAGTITRSAREWRWAGS